MKSYGDDEFVMGRAGSCGSVGRSNKGGLKSGKADVIQDGVDEWAGFAGLPRCQGIVQERGLASHVIECVRRVN